MEIVDGLFCGRGWRDVDQVVGIMLADGVHMLVLGGATTNYSVWYGFVYGVTDCYLLFTI